MKKMFLMSCACLALTAGLASAGPGGLNLSWIDCGAAGTDNQTFACNTNSAVPQHLLVVSYVAPCCVTGCSALDYVMDVQSAGAALPAWWSMRGTAPIGCRNAALGQSPDFSSGPFGPCLDYWQGQATGAVSMDPPAGNRGRIKGLAGLPSGSPLIGPIAEGTEVYAAKVTVNNTKTVGTPNCAGCQEGVCIVLNQVNVAQPVSEPGGQKAITTPGSRNFVTWQNGIGIDCFHATPAKNTTWGSVKALYR